MNLLFFDFNSTILAEGEGFEPSVRFTARRFSRPVPSTTRSPFRTIYEFWRRRGDSNPRYRSLHTNDLANRPLQPLGYSSRFSLNTTIIQRLILDKTLPNLYST